MQNLAPKLLAIVSSLLLSLSPLWADIPFVSIGIDEGLSNNSVRCITQDAEGYVWFGTKDGLNRYDGSDFRVYRKSAESGLGSSMIRSLHSAIDGTLYIGTEEGTYVYNRSTDGFRLLSPEITSATLYILEDKQGGLWLCCGTSGIYYYSTIDGSTAHYEPTYEGETLNFWCATLDSSGRVWFASMSGGVICRYDYALGEFTTIPLPRPNCEVNAIYYDQLGGGILLGTLVDGLYRYDLDLCKWELLMDSYEGRPLRNVHTIMDNGADSFYIGCDNGILVYNRTGECEELPCSKYTSEDNASIYCLYRDREGGLWAGTYYYGLLYLRPNFRAIEQFDARPKNSPKGRSIVSCFAQGCEDEVWIGTNNGGMMLYYPLDGIVKDVIGPQASSNIKSILDDEDELWVGYYHNGIERFTHRAERLYHQNSYSAEVSGLSHNSIYSIFRSRSGELYIGTQMGLDRYNASRDGFDNILLGTRINDIKEDPTGCLWLGTSDRGLVSYNPTSGRSEQYSVEEGIPSGTVYSLCFDSDMNVYCACSKGIAMLNRETLSVHLIRPDLPQLCDIVDYVAFGQGGRLWASTNNGICYINLDTDEVRFYYKGDGLQSNQFNENAGLSCPDGSLLLGGVNGFNVIRPSLLGVKNQSEPQLSLSCGYFTGDELKIKARDGKLSFEASVLSYYSPESNRCQYIMEGVDDEWTSGQGKLRFQYNLPPGRYTLRLRGENADGVSSSEERAMTIRVVPPFYLSSWMIAFYIILLLSTAFVMVYMVMRHIRGKHQNEMLQLEARKNEELSNSRVTFFSNIIYELSNPLSQIRSALDRGDIEVVNEGIGKLSALLERLRDFRKVQDDALIFSPTAGEVSPEEDESAEVGGRIVLIDDNAAQKEYLYDTLGESYEISEGMEEALKGLSDLIIFDENVPQVNDLFKQVRSHQNSCHIPAILLSARTDELSRKKALALGYDAIGEKPLSVKLLTTQIDNLIKSRQAIREKYIRSPLLPAQSIAHNSKDAEFIERANAAIAEHLAETDNIIDVVAEALNMSRVNFRKKLTRLSGLPPSRYIQMARLKKAAELLRTTDMKVSEVGYSVGFATPSYFAKCFAAEFGVLPKDYRR